MDQEITWGRSRISRRLARACYGFQDLWLGVSELLQLALLGSYRISTHMARLFNAFQYIMLDLPCVSMVWRGMLTAFPAMVPCRLGCPRRVSRAW